MSTARALDPEHSRPWQSRLCMSYSSARAVVSPLAIWMTSAVLTTVLLGCQTVPTTRPNGTSTSELDQIAHRVNDRGKPALAASLYQQAVDKAPTAPHYIALGRARLAADQLHPAANAFRSALKQDPDNPQALLGLGEARRGLGQPGYAIRALRPAARRLNTVHAWTELGLADIANGDAGSAVDAFQQAVKQSGPSDLSSRTNLALARALAGQTSEATVAMREICNSPLAEAPHFRDLLLILVLSGQQTQARELNIPGMTPRHKTALLNRARRIHALSGTAERARAIGLITTG